MSEVVYVVSGMHDYVNLLPANTFDMQEGAGACSLLLAALIYN